MSRFIESDSFETRIPNILEDGFTDTGWDSHVFYEFDDLVKNGLIGDVNKDSDNPSPELPSISGISTLFVSNPYDTKSSSINKVKTNTFVEKRSHIPSGGYIYPLDSNLSGYSTDLWNSQLGYRNQNGKEYADYLMCKKNISGNAISSIRYNYYDNIFSCPQPYDKTIGTKPCYTYDGVHSFSSPSSNLLKYGKIGNYLQYSWQSCIYEYSGYEFKKLKSNLVNSPDGFRIRGYQNKTSSPYFKTSFTAKSNSKYTVSFYAKTSSNNCKITLPYICDKDSTVFNTDTYTVTKDWSRVYYVSPEVLSLDNTYNITFKWIEGYNDDSCDLKVCAIVCEEGEVPTLYTSQNQSYVTGSETDSYHQLVALKLINASSTYIPNVFIYDKIQKTNEACYDTLGNIKFGYDKNGILKVNDTLTGVDFSSHIGSWEHIYIKIFNNNFTYISIDNSGNKIEATVSISDFDYNILISKMWSSDDYIGSEILENEDHFLTDVTCNIILGAYIDNNIVITHDTIYRNFITYSENSEDNLILRDYFSKISSPCMTINHATEDYDTDIIKIQSPIFIEKDLED